MIRNFLKISIRNLSRNKVFSMLNIMGLAIGLTAAILILLYTSHEVSYDNFHADADRIHRVTLSFKNGDSYTTTTTTAHRIAPLMAETFPEIESFFRMYYTFNSQREVIYGDKRINITNNMTFADPNMFSFFTFELISGDPGTALDEPTSVVITESEAKKLFGSEDPMGKTVTHRTIYNDVSTDFQVTGIVKDIPSNSHFHYGYFFSQLAMENYAPNMAKSWGWTSQNSYIKLHPGADIDKVHDGLKEMIDSNAPEWYQEWAYLSTQPLLDIHLKSHLKEEIEPTGDATYVRLLMAIALFVILIACINYMNLATSLATKRAKEVGIKKAVGAGKKQLVFQFLFESVLTLSIAAVFAITLVQLSLPFFNGLTGRTLSLFTLPYNYFLIGFVLLIALGILSGTYPAFFLSSFQPIRTLSGKSFKVVSGSVVLRKGLVVTQFVISTFLICATIIILNQWEYMREKAKGIETDQIVFMRLTSRKSVDNYHLLRSELLKQSNVTNVSACSKSPTGRYDGFGTMDINGETHSIPLESIDEHFFTTFNISLISGRNFSPNIASDSSAMILNKTAVELLGIDNVIGTTAQMGDHTYKVIGVVDDFHFEPLYTKLGPVAFFYNANWYNYAYAKINTADIERSLEAITSVWKEVNPTDEFNYMFVNKEVEQAYHSEQQFFWIFTVFSGLAIFIACLGLFGLASFTVSQKIKEIGIRKTLGASAGSIALLLSRKFTTLVIAANVISWPLAYFIMNGWLEKFPYRTTIGIGVFLVTGLLSLIIALLSVGGNSIKASLVNPVESLRYE